MAIKGTVKTEEPKAKIKTKSRNNNKGDKKPMNKEH